MSSLVQPITVSSLLTVQMLLLAANQIIGFRNHLPEPAQNIWLEFFGLSVGLAVDTTVLFSIGPRCLA